MAPPGSGITEICMFDIACSEQLLFSVCDIVFPRENQRVLMHICYILIKYQRCSSIRHLCFIQLGIYLLYLETKKYLSTNTLNRNPPGWHKLSLITCSLTYTRGHNVWPNLGSQETLTDFHGNEAKKIISF